ncbi:hypothetical protein JCM9279_003432 [Rhodotorula babjevae]
MQAPEAAPSTAPHAPSSTSSGDPSPTPSTSKHPFDPAASGPSHPSSFLPNQARHSRRPSRAERYEAIVASAREVLARGTRRSSVEGVGLGLSSSGPTAREGKRRSRLEEVAAEVVGRNEWEDTVRSLLRVVDGMTQQLATHDDLAAQLKIAQSNLALAETHSEFLEDTLRRRESVSSSSQAMARHHSGPGTQRRGSADTPEQSSLGGLFGLGLSADGDASSGGAKSFFRLPSKRKPTTSSASSASNSLPAPPSRGLRSVASSPLLKDASPNPASPTDQPRFSSSTFSSIDESSLSVPFNSGGTSPTFPRELFALQAQVSSLETECTALRSNNASLKRSNETLVAKCAELEKTTEDLMSELENLSVELFSEANTLVADERKLRAKADEEVERLRGDVDALTSQLSSLRVALAHRPAFLDVTSPALPALPHSAPTTPAMPMSSDSLQAFPSSYDRPSASSRTDADAERPVSAVSARRWNPFSRASVPAPSPDPAVDPPPPSTSALSTSLHAPSMARGDSGESHVSASSAASFFSSRSHPVRSASSAYERSPVLPAADVQRRVTSPSVKGKDKARELELGIQVPSAAAAMAGAGGEWMARTESDGGTTVGAKTPHAPDGSYSMRDVAVSQQPLSASPTSSLGVSPSGPAPRQSGDSARSPRSPLPGTFPPALRAPHSQDDATPVPDRAAPVFAGPRLRPPRGGDGSTAAPRPLAIHTDVTPPMLAGGFSHPVDGARIGGPTAAEMTAASKSPKSPNELRWNKVAGSLDSNGTAPSSSSSSRARSNSRSSVERVTEARRWDRENLPPSPALPDGFDQQQQKSAPQLVRQPSDERTTSSALQEPPSSRVKAPTSTPASITSRLRLDTSSARLNGSSASSASPRSLSARPAAPAARPTLARTASTADAVPFPGPISTAQLAAASGPATASATTRPTFLRANSSSSASAPARGGDRVPGGGMTPSTSASSLASRSSASSGAALLSPGGSASGTTSGGRSRAGSHGRPLSPDGARAVEDLDSLMRSIVEMSEGLFDSAQEEGGAASTERGGTQ